MKLLQPWAVATKRPDYKKGTGIRGVCCAKETGEKDLWFIDCLSQTISCFPDKTPKKGVKRALNIRLVLYELASCPWLSLLYPFHRPHSDLAINQLDLEPEINCGGDAVIGGKQMYSDKADQL